MTKGILVNFEERMVKIPRGGNKSVSMEKNASASLSCILSAITNLMEVLCSFEFSIIKIQAM